MAAGTGRRDVPGACGSPSRASPCSRRRRRPGGVRPGVPRRRHRHPRHGRLRQHGRHRRGAQPSWRRETGGAVVHRRAAGHRGHRRRRVHRRRPGVRAADRRSRDRHGGGPPPDGRRRHVARQRHPRLAVRDHAQRRHHRPRRQRAEHRLLALGHDRAVLRRAGRGRHVRRRRHHRHQRRRGRLGRRQGRRAHRYGRRRHHGGHHRRRRWLPPVHRARPGHAHVDLAGHGRHLPSGLGRERTRQDRLVHQPAAHRHASSRCRWPARSSHSRSRCSPRAPCSPWHGRAGWSECPSPGRGHCSRFSSSRWSSAPGG